MSCQYFRENHTTCAVCSQNSEVVAQEKGRKYSLINEHKREVCKIHVDGCVIVESDTRKCDYLVLSCETNMAYFIELKGSDLSGAIKQLDQSIDQLLINLKGNSINARAVLSKSPTPNMRPSNYAPFIKKITRLGGTFKYGSKLIEDMLG